MHVWFGACVQFFHVYMYAECSHSFRGLMRFGYTFTYFVSQISFCLYLFRNTLHEVLPLYFIVLYNIILLYYEVQYLTRKTVERDASTKLFRTYASKERMKMEQTICSICLEELTDTCVSTRSCAHLFHRPCIQRWMLYKDTCPYCRTLI